MPTTRYGLSVRLATQQRYGVETSAAPVLAGQKRYALSTENRQIVSTAYPLQTERYSIRYGRDMADSAAWAKRREREFFAALVAPEVQTMDERIFGAVDMPLAAARNTLNTPITLESTEAGARVIESAAAFVLTDPLTLRDRLYNAHEETQATAMQDAPHDAQAINLDQWVRRTVSNAHGAILDELQHRPKTYDARISMEPDRGSIQNQQTDAYLYEIESMKSPYKLAEEQVLDAAATRARIYAAESLHHRTGKRLNDPLETAELTPDAARGQLHATLATEQHPHVGKGYAPPAETELLEQHAAQYKVRTFNAIIEAWQTGKTSGVTDTTMQPIDAAQLVNNVNEALISTYDKISWHERLFDTVEAAPISAGHDPMHDAILETSEPAALQQVTPLVEYLPYDAADKQAPATAAILEADDVGALARTLGIELLDMDAMRGFESGSVVEMVDYFSTTRLLPTIDAILEVIEGFDDIKFVVEELTLDPATRIVPIGDIIESDFITPKIKNPETPTVLSDYTPAALERESTAQLEAGDRGTIERIRPALLHRDDTGTRQRHVLAMLEEADQITRDTIRDAETIALDAADRNHETETEWIDTTPADREQTTAATMDGWDYLTRTIEEGLLVEHTEATRDAINPATEETFAYGTKTLAYAELLDDMQASRTMKAITLSDYDRAQRKAISDAVLETISDADKYMKKKKRIWLIPARGNHWSNWSNWKKTR